jgi:penicillin-binding protein 2
MTGRSTLRLFVLRVMVVALLATLFGRLWFLQVYAADEYVRAAGENRVREVVETAPRGEVVDARGAPLVVNRTTLVVSVDRSVLLRQPDDGAAVLRRSARCSGGLPSCWPRRSARAAGACGSPAGAARRTSRCRWPASTPATRPAWPGCWPSRSARGLPRRPRAVRGRPGVPAGHAGGARARLPGSDQPRGGRHLAYDGVQPSALIGRAGVEATYDRALRGRGRRHPAARRPRRRGHR